MSVVVSLKDREDEVSRATADYKRLFGEEAVSDKMQLVTREQSLERLVRDLKFWKDRCPDLAHLNCPEAIARYAVCLNAIDNLRDLARKLKAEEEVLRRTDRPL